MQSRVFTTSLLTSTLLLVSAPGLTEDATKAVTSIASQTLPDAKPGECYGKIMVPAEYKTETKEIVKREAYDKIDIIPAKYQNVEEKIVVKQAAEKLVPVAPVYETFEERVEIEPAKRTWMTGSGSKARAADPSLVAGAMALGLPAQAEIGQCFVEYFQTAQYKTETQNVVKREPYEELEIVPAKYEMVEEKVVVKEAAFKLVEVPPVYETVTEKVLEAPAYTTWKKGRGPVEKLDYATGDIMCLVEVPAKYKTVKRQILKSPATTKKVEIPAEYKVQKVRKLVQPAKVNKIEVPGEYETIKKKVKVSDAKSTWALAGQAGEGKATKRKLCLREKPARYEVITKQVLKSPATTKKVEIPAIYKTQMVRKLVQPATEKRSTVPAVVEKLTSRVKVSNERFEWRPVLCQTNMSKELNLQIQQALKDRGYNPGPIDGVIGRQTMVAVDQFQQKEGMERGGLTLSTLSSLGVKVAK